MVLYFSGTGNSKFVAHKIAARIGEKAHDLFPYMKNCEKKTFSSITPFIFVCPTHAWQIPRVLRDYIKFCKFEGSKFVYFVMTCGDSIGDAQEYAKGLCQEKGLELLGVFKIVMPENYTAMFSTPNEKEAVEIIYNSLVNIEATGRYIKQQEKMLGNANFKDKLLSGTVNNFFYKYCVKDKDFWTTDQCISCGICEKYCVVNNITMVDGKPKWNGNCTHCMACINHCPKEAIEYGKKSKGKPRYKCPEDSFTIK